MDKNSRKKGVTLAEIVIVLAVVAIMSTMVVSFSIACNMWVEQGVNRHETLSSFYLLKGGVKDFADSFDDENHEFFTDGQRLSVYDVNSPADEPLYYIEFTGDALAGVSAAGEFAYPADNITAVRFLLIKSELSGKTLVKFTVSYSVPPMNKDRNPETGDYEIMYALRVAGGRVA